MVGSDFAGKYSQSISGSSRFGFPRRRNKIWPSDLRGIFDDIYTTEFGESNLPSDRKEVSREKAQDIVDHVLSSSSLHDSHNPDPIQSWNAEEIRVKVRDELLNRDVALKVALGDAAIGCLTQEARLLTLLAGPGVVPVYQLSVLSNKTALLITQHVETRSVLEFVKEGKLGLHGALGYMASVCRAVERAHSRGVILGNLSWTSVRLTEDREPMMVDFSSARFGDQPSLDIQSLGRMLEELIAVTNGPETEMALKRVASIVDTCLSGRAVGCLTVGEIARQIEHCGADFGRFEASDDPLKENEGENRNKRISLVDLFVLVAVGLMGLLLVTGFELRVLICAVGIYGGVASGCFLVSEGLRRREGVLRKICYYSVGFLLIFESILLITKILH